MAMVLLWAICICCDTEEWLPGLGVLKRCRSNTWTVLRVRIHIELQQRCDVAKKHQVLPGSCMCCRSPVRGNSDCATCASSLLLRLGLFRMERSGFYVVDLYRSNRLREEEFGQSSDPTSRHGRALGIALDHMWCNAVGSVDHIPQHILLRGVHLRTLSVLEV